MTELSKKQRKPVVQGRIYKTYHRTWRQGQITGLFVRVGNYVYSEFQKYTTKAGAVRGAERMNWEHPNPRSAKFRAFNTDKGWAVYQRHQNTGPYAITPAILKDENWWRNH